MKANKCVSCDNKTFQKDGVCVSCKIGLRQIYNELIELLQKDSRGKLLIAKAAQK